MKTKNEAFAFFDMETSGNNPKIHRINLFKIGLFTFDIDNNIQIVDYWNQQIIDPCHFVYTLSQWLFEMNSLFNIKWVANKSHKKWMFLKICYECFTLNNQQTFDIGFFCHDLKTLLTSYFMISDVPKHHINIVKSTLTQGYQQTIQKYAKNNQCDIRSYNACLSQGYQYMKLRKLLSDYKHTPRTIDNSKLIKHKNTCYASFDVELDGNNPIQYSMRSIGIVLTILDEKTNKFKTIAKFYKKIYPQHQGYPEHKCMVEFWNKHPEEWKDLNKDNISPKSAMNQLSSWLHNHLRNKHMKLVWVAGPSNIDWMFLKTYYETYCNCKKKFNIGSKCLDLKSLLRAYSTMHNIENKKEFENNLASVDYTYDHIAIHDALYQGSIFTNLITTIYTH